MSSCCIPFVFDFGRFDSQTVMNILRASSHSSIRSQQRRAARGEAVKHLRGAGERGPRVASARRGTGIRGSMGASMSDAMIPSLKHRIPSELRSYACLGESSTRMGDLLGSHRVEFLFFSISAVSIRRPS